MNRLPLSIAGAMLLLTAGMLQCLFADLFRFLTLSGSFRCPMLSFLNIMKYKLLRQGVGRACDKPPAPPYQAPRRN